MKYFSQLEDIQNIGKGHCSPVAIWRIWEHRYRTRKQLHALLLSDPDRLHDDLGLSSEEVQEEIRKPFWR